MHKEINQNYDGKKREFFFAIVTSCSKNVISFHFILINSLTKLVTKEVLINFCLCWSYGSK